MLVKCNIDESKDYENVTVKIFDFGCSEIFKNNDFRCDKFATALNRIQLAPKMSCYLQYDARKADLWALGIMFYEAFFAQQPFRSIPMGSSEDSQTDHTGYDAIYGGEVRKLIESQGLMPLLSGKKCADILALLEGLLNVDEDLRWTTAEVLKATYFESYYKTYYSQILQLRKENMNEMEKQAKLSKIIETGGVVADTVLSPCSPFKE